MFLGRLRPSEKLAFLQLAHLLVNADGQRTEAEQRLFEAMAEEMRFAFEPDEVTTTQWDEAVAQFREPASKRIALMELLSLSYADKEFAEKERALIKRLAAAFDVNDSELQRLDGWVQRMMELTAEGLRLIGDPGGEVLQAGA